MSRTTAQVSFLDEIIVDSFAGGGGASTGIELATGRPVTIAINHDPDAILMHKTNHPYTEHYQASVWDVDPRQVCQGRPVGLLWASPDCKHFSKAKGGKPVDKNIRGLAWIVLRWAGTVAPRVIMLENVEEFQTWGPVRKGRPVKSKAGQTFRRWLYQLEALGYAVEWRELVAADYGAPTTRKRFFLIARRDGEPIVWPEPTHAPAEVYGDWDAAAYLRRVVELIHPNRQINIPDLEAMIRAATKAGEDICTYCPDCNCRDCIVNEWKEDPDDE